MTALKGFVGPSYQAPSYRADVEQTINWIPQVVTANGRVTDRFLNQPPGLLTFASMSLAPIRAVFAQDGLMFAVVGFGFLEIFSNGTSINRGTVNNDYLPAWIGSSGDAGGQLGIRAGGSWYNYDLVTHALTSVPAAGINLVASGYLDGYFWTLDDASTFHLSNLLDGTTWDPLQVAQRNDAPDRWVGGLTLGKYIWLFGSETTSVLYDSGAFPFPFTLVPGVLINQGLGAVSSVVDLNGTAAWIAQSRSGGRTILRSDGFGVPIPISNRAVEAAIGQYASASDAVGFAYTYNGEWIYQVNFPSANDAWAFIPSSGEWVKPLFWNTTTAAWECSRAQYHCVAFDKHLVGDRQTGTIYQLSATTYTDAGGAPMRRVRRCPLPRLTDTSAWVRLRELQILMDVGIGRVSGQGVDPQVMLRISRDGGKTWGPEHWTTAGAMGAYLTRVLWQRLGRYRDGLGVIEIVITDPVPARLIGAEFEAA